MGHASRRVALLTLVVLGTITRSVAAEPLGARLVGPFAKDEYPQAVIDRPLTLPAGMVEAELGWRFLSVSPAGFDSGGFDDWDADVAVRVGVTDRLQVEAGTSFSLDHTHRGSGSDLLRPNVTSWSRVVPLRLSLLALDTEAIDTALTLTLPFVAHASRRVAVGRGRGRSVTIANDDGRVVPQVGLAAPTRWRLTDWLWLRAGENLLAVTTARGVANFTFNLGLGVQPHRLLAVTLDSAIAGIAFDGSGHEASLTVADQGTIDLQGVLAVLPGFDVIGGLAVFDVGRGFDDYTTRIAVRVRI